MNEELRQHPSWMREFDHTADLGVEVEASNIEQLFERTAYAMFWLIADVDDVESDISIPIEIDAEDIDALMVAWLSELNYRHQVDGLVFSRFQVAQISDSSLLGTAIGEGISRGRPRVFGEIKAVTYHDLQVGCDGDRCRARVIFDI
jgi:SHS2 domain-containing protein